MSWDAQRCGHSTDRSLPLSTPDQTTKIGSTGGPHGSILLLQGQGDGPRFKSDDVTRGVWVDETNLLHNISTLELDEAVAVVVVVMGKLLKWTIMSDVINVDQCVEARGIASTMVVGVAACPSQGIRLFCGLQVLLFRVYKNIVPFRQKFSGCLDGLGGGDQGLFEMAPFTFSIAAERCLCAVLHEKKGSEKKRVCLSVSSLGRLQQIASKT
ncbi:hypothetical protein QBC38DRAFT_541990 [Podospora fimiseda]|uniref:Uncharacterized protein n=1 Tax=Podospora fimiseda TaxID=252190 RepID=A0AAN7BWI5_9PEZI|nr:hypothetical protein QBC38DRAFT_541990 [Podospora fimiseda]